MLKINPHLNETINWKEKREIQKPNIKYALENLFSISPDLFNLVSREYDIANICITLSVSGHMRNKLIYLSGCDLKLKLSGNEFEVIDKNERPN
jgi:hypothetical protein